MTQHTFNAPTAVIITGVGHALPPTSVSSAEVARRVNLANGFRMPASLIERLSGVAHRYYLEDGCSSDLAVQASMMAMQQAHVTPDSIDMLIFAAASHDVTEPATANIVQEKIGCHNAHVMDVKNACNSFLNALDIAHSFVQTGRAQRIVVCSGEVLSPSINWHIENATDLYLKFAGLTLGDGGGACVVEPSMAASDAGRGMMRGYFQTDGTQWRLSTMLSCGTMMRHDTSRMYFESQSRKMQTLAARYIPALLHDVTRTIGWDMRRDVRLVVPHQVSRRVIEIICQKVNYPIEQCMVTVDRVGNTAAASIPIALSMALAEGRVQRGDKLLLIGGAAGFSAGVVPLVW